VWRPLPISFGTWSYVWLLGKYMDLTLVCLCTDKIKCDPIYCHVWKMGSWLSFLAVVRKRRLSSSCRTQVKLFLCPICLKPDDGEMVVIILWKCKEMFSQKIHTYQWQTWRRQWLVLTDYSAVVYRYYFLTYCLPMHYDKICISK